jgi:hypothetical protein
MPEHMLTVPTVKEFSVSGIYQLRVAYSRLKNVVTFTLRTKVKDKC